MHQEASVHHRNPRRRILEAAAQVFAEQGFAGARVDEIARQSKINKAMLYYHVGDKAALYQAVLVRNFELLKEQIEAKIVQKESPEEQLRAFIEALATAVEDLAYHPRIMMRELASGGANITPEIFAKLMSIFEHLRSILDRGVDSGRFRPTSPLLTHFSIVASVIMATIARPMLENHSELLPAAAQEGFRWDQIDLAKHITTLLMHGLLRGER